MRVHPRRLENLIVTNEDRKKTEDFLYRGHRFLGRLLTLPPFTLFLRLSAFFTALFFVPAMILRVDCIWLETKFGPRYVGLSQSPNWSLMFPLVLPALFAGIAWASNQMRQSVEKLVHGEVAVIKALSADSKDYVEAFSENLARTGQILVVIALILAIAFSLIDISNIVRGSHKWLLGVPHPHPGDPNYPFQLADTYWTVAFTLDNGRYQRHWFPAVNLAFDGLAYLGLTTRS